MDKNLIGFIDETFARKPFISIAFASNEKNGYNQIPSIFTLIEDIGGDILYPAYQKVTNGAFFEELSINDALECFTVQKVDNMKLFNLIFIPGDAEAFVSSLRSWLFNYCKDGSLSAHVRLSFIEPQSLKK